MATFSGFYESHEPPPLGDVRSIVPLHRHGHQNGRQSGHILHRSFVCCCPGGRQGNTEQLVAHWRHLCTKALDLLHQTMRIVWHRHTAMAVEMARDGGKFVRCCRLFCLIKT